MAGHGNGSPAQPSFQQPGNQKTDFKQAMDMRWFERGYSFDRSKKKETAKKQQAGIRRGKRDDNYRCTQKEGEAVGRIDGEQNDGQNGQGKEGRHNSLARRRGPTFWQEPGFIFPPII